MPPLEVGNQRTDLLGRNGYRPVFRSPLTDYDTWACLAPGFLLLAAADHAAELGLIWRDSWTTTAAIFTAASAYVVGQACSSIASALLERGLIHRVLLPPSRVLIDPSAGPQWARTIFGPYYRPLAPPVPKRILERSRDAGIADGGDAIFQWAYAVARENKGVSDKLATFLNQYGMARNTALAAFLGAVMIAWFAWIKPSPNDWLWATAGLVSSIILLHRFLKYYQLYTAEIFRFIAFQEKKNAS